MFNIGLGELLLLLLVMVCVTKPQDWPKMAYFCGQCVHKVRQTLHKLTQDLVR